jgi:hypothetical protein
MGRRAGRINANQLAHGLTAYSMGEPTSMEVLQLHNMHKRHRPEPCAATQSAMKQSMVLCIHSQVPPPSPLTPPQHRRAAPFAREATPRHEGGPGDHLQLEIICRASRDARRLTLPIFIFARVDLGCEPIRGAVSAAAAVAGVLYTSVAAPAKDPIENQVHFGHQDLSHQQELAGSSNTLM